MKKQLLVLLATFAVSFNAHSLFELRAGYGVNTPSDDTLSTGATLSNMTGLNLDAIVELPMVPFGFGLRYETMGLEVQTSNLGNLDTDMTRTSLLVNYRFIDLFTYLGIIGTVGFANEVVVNALGTETKYDADMTFSVGVEGGVSLGLIMIGGELGMNMANYKNDSPLVSPNEVDFSGPYFKAIVGVGF